MSFRLNREGSEDLRRYLQGSTLEGTLEGHWFSNPLVSVFAPTFLHIRINGSVNPIRSKYFKINDFMLRTLYSSTPFLASNLSNSRFSGPLKDTMHMSRLGRPCMRRIEFSFGINLKCLGNMDTSCVIRCINGQTNVNSIAGKLESKAFMYAQNSSSNLKCSETRTLIFRTCSDFKIVFPDTYVLLTFLTLSTDRPPG